MEAVEKSKSIDYSSFNMDLWAQTFKAHTENSDSL